jgi:hypothetical protein
VELTWRKSSHSSGGSGSGNSGDCVEVTFGSTGPLLRDSKAGTILRTSPTGFAAFLRHVNGAAHS